MTTKPIDKSKKSNKRCQNCQNWTGEYAPCELWLSAMRSCSISGTNKYYYQCCKQFGWNEEKTYVDESKGGKQ